MPPDITVMFEHTKTSQQREEEKSTDIQHPTFNDRELETYTEQQIAAYKASIVDSKGTDGELHTATAVK